MNELTQRLTSGALAGLAATAPMTVVMEAMHRLLPWWQQQALPPRRVTMRAMHATGTGLPQHESSRLAATLVSHFAMGTSAGALYGVAAPEIPGPPAVKGIAYGLLVWAGNYLGVLPALGLLTPATRHPPQRNVLMILAHVVYGAVLGLATDRMQQERPMPLLAKWRRPTSLRKE